MMRCLVYLLVLGLIAFINSKSDIYQVHVYNAAAVVQR